LKTRGPTRRPFTSGCEATVLTEPDRQGGRYSPMKKLMLLIVVLALGAVVAKKVKAA
jgi:hypothetical protein